MFVVISKFYDNKIVISRPVYSENVEPKFEHKTEYDIYTDVFSTKEEAVRFYENQIDESA